MIFYICWRQMKATSQCFFFSPHERESKSMFPSACWFCCDVFFGFGLGFLLFGSFLVFCFFSGIAFTRCITDILFGITCPPLLWSSSQARLVREPLHKAFAMQLWCSLHQVRNHTVWEMPLLQNAAEVLLLWCTPVPWAVTAFAAASAHYLSVNAMSRLCSVCQYFKVKSGKICLSNRQKDRKQDGHVFKVSDWGSEICFQFPDLSKTFCTISNKLLNLSGISSPAMKWEIISSCLEE